MLAVTIGWVLFAVNGLEEFEVYIMRMFGGYMAYDFMDHIISVSILLVSGVFFATPLFSMIYEKIKNGIPGLILHLVLFWASITALVDAAYNPFLYFRF